MKYQVIVEQDEDGVYVVEVPPSISEEIVEVSI